MSLVHFIIRLIAIMNTVIELKEWKEILLLPKIVFWQFFAWKEYNFPSGFLTNTILNFAQEWNFPGIQ